MLIQLSLEILGERYDHKLVDSQFRWAVLIGNVNKFIRDHICQYTLVKLASTNIK